MWSFSSVMWPPLASTTPAIMMIEITGTKGAHQGGELEGRSRASSFPATAWVAMLLLFIVPSELQGRMKEHRRALAERAS